MFQSIIKYFTLLNDGLLYARTKKVKEIQAIAGSYAALLVFITTRNSCIAARDASIQTEAATMFIPFMPTRKGKRKRVKPVILFIIVWSATNECDKTKPMATLTTFIKAMTAAQTQTHPSNSMTGSSLHKHTATKTISAKLSIRSPKRLSQFVLRATKPSTMSDNPQRQ